ncbi:Phage integrase family protein [compost metagenome]
MNVMHRQGRDHLDFKGREFERPTYIFKAHFKLDVARGVIDADTANNKIRSVVRYYRWRMKYRWFRPTKPAWKENIIWVAHTNQFGFARTKEVITTDLTFAKNKEESSDYIYDGGKLRPLEKHEQAAMILALIATQNTEMLLAFLLALVTGMRIQTVLTLRIGDVFEGSATDFNTYVINAGEDCLVDTKYDKTQKIEVPGWMHHRLFTYLQSERYLSRKEKALEREDHEQYVFLSRTGKPLYVSKLDKDQYKRHEKGSAVRKFIKDTLSPLLKSRGHNFTFSFHDLRASFGMNLIEERNELLENGDIGYLELIDFVAKRLYHSNPKTTMGYLDYRRVNKLVHEADAKFQQHIIELLERD